VKRVIVAARLSRKARNYGIGIETQDKLCREWAERQGYDVVSVVADYKRSTVPPWDRKNLRPWVTRPDLMQKYDAIIAYRQDRLSRGEWADETRIRQWASDNNKILMIVDGPQWPPRHDGDFWQWEAGAQAAHKELLEIRERCMRAQRQLKETGKLIGRCPRGYVPAGDKYDKTMMPTEDAKIWVPEMFQRIRDGQSCREVGAWLSAWLSDRNLLDGPKISGTTIDRMIRNRTYMGTRLDGKGRPMLSVPSLVDATLWVAANNRLDNAPRRRRTPTDGEPAFLTSVIFCLRCHERGIVAPMYRIQPPDNRPGEDRGYSYRCAGSFPERKGCGNMVSLAKTDAFVTSLLSTASQPYKELRLVPGENYDVDITKILLEIRDLTAKGLTDVEEDAERDRLRSERDRLIELNKTAMPDKWEDVPTGKTVGEHFNSLDDAGRREMVLSDVKVYAENPHGTYLAGITDGYPLVRIESHLFKIPLGLDLPDVTIIPRVKASAGRDDK
jgi:DNA invertase Pin-like site-specific DNA recombinase